MPELKYKVIATKSQYNEYCQKLEALVFSHEKKSAAKDEIDLLTLLIEKWDADHNTFNDLDPIELLRSLMKDHKLKATDLVDILGVSKGYISEILHYKKGLSKDAVRILAARFKLAQEAFNRPYPLAKDDKPVSKANKPGSKTAKPRKPKRKGTPS
jgi:HTH-type transcriptional regulator/antitoxin HigA